MKKLKEKAGFAAKLLLDFCEAIIGLVGTIAAIIGVVCVWAFTLPIGIYHYYHGMFFGDKKLHETAPLKYTSSSYLDGKEEAKEFFQNLFKTSASFIQGNIDLFGKSLTRLFGTKWRNNIKPRQQIDIYIVEAKYRLNFDSEPFLSLKYNYCKNRFRKMSLYSIGALFILSIFGGIKLPVISIALQATCLMLTVSELVFIAENNRKIIF